MDRDALLTVDTVINDRYRVEDHLGTGGYSEVVEAFDRNQKRRVALKVLHREATDTDPRAGDRMRQEAEILRALDHPNIVHIFDVDTFDKGRFLVMEYVDGTGLDELLERQAPFETQRLLPLVRQLLDALQAAHETSILHRDLKPENILVVDAGGREQIKLIDFGVAKASSLLNTDDPDEGVTLVKTQAGNFVGTPRYAAPEMVVGDPLAANSDLFCLGLVVYEALSGKPLLEGTSQREVMNELVFPRPFELDAVDDRWAKWLTPILEKSPERRMETAREGRHHLDEIFDAGGSVVQSTSPEADDEPRHPTFSDDDDAVGDPMEPTREVDPRTLLEPHQAPAVDDSEDRVDPDIPETASDSTDVEQSDDDEPTADRLHAQPLPKSQNGGQTRFANHSVLSFVVAGLFFFVVASMVFLWLY